MKLIRKLNSDDIITVIRNYFNVPKADINLEFVTKTIGYGLNEEECQDIIVSIEEDGYEVS